MNNKTKIFNKYQELFLEKNKILNLISKNDEKYLYEKHIFDSLEIQLFFEKYPNNYQTMLDIGTGGGFPALPVAIQYPNIKVTGIDSTKKKIVAIQDIADKLGLTNFSTICDRVENIKDVQFDLITSRAVARLDIILKYAFPLLKKNGYIVIYKSKKVNEEIEECKKTLKNFNAKIIDVVEYKLPMEEVYTRNLVVIKHV